jgi:hypothetical protein
MALIVSQDAGRRNVFAGWGSPRQYDYANIYPRTVFFNHWITHYLTDNPRP